jgi:6-phosphogluconolactonase (cycloisomerase 2 family)
MKFRFLAWILVFLAVMFEASCSSSNNSANNGSGLLYLATQGDATLTSYGITLSTGGLTGLNAVATGNNPVAIAITPAVDALFVANNGGNSVTGYQINSDGSLTVGNTYNVGTSPMGLTVDSSGKFLFVANQGSSNVSVFSISGNNLTAVAGSPFTTIAPGTTTPTGPTSVAAPPAGNYLYVGNQFTNTISAFSYDTSSGALTAVAGSPYASCVSATTACIAPSALEISPNGQFLLVANSGSNNVSSFGICVIQSATCATPDGTMTAVSGSPFTAGGEPSSIAFDPGFNYVYVVDKQYNQVSEYSFSTGTGALTPLSTATVSTGTTPVSIAVRSGATGSDVGNTTTNPTDYAYVTNIGGTSMTVYSLATSSGVLTTLGTPFVTAGQPSAVSVK